MSDTLAITPLHELHQRLGAKMVPFAGYDMPVQYPLGVLKEHQHTRAEAGLFDVSHMGQVKISAADGYSLSEVAEALESILPQNILALPEGMQRYGFFTNAEGGIRDDLMLSNLSDHFFMVVNAACKHDDFAYMREQLPDFVQLEMLEDRALLALQGPKARAVLARLAPGQQELFFMEVASLKVAGIDCLVSCSGYTGEDGYELSAAAADAVALAEALLAEGEVEAIGLGARDSLRLEAGLCLYGHDINTETTPVMANLKWAVSPVRRPGAERAGGYPGADIVAEQWQAGTAQTRVMLTVDGRAPVREGAELVNADGETIGRVCSGGFGPTVGGPVVMAYVNSDVVESDTPIFAALRGKQIPLVLAKGSLLPSRYARRPK